MGRGAEKMRRRRAAWLLVSASLLVVERDALAYRPFDGTDADVAEYGALELELGPTHYYREGDRNFLIAPATVLNLGIAKDTEIVVDFDDFVALGALDPGEPRVRTMDTDVLLKHVFREGVLQEKSGPSIAVEAGPLLPDIHGTSAFGASLAVIASYRWSFGSIHWNEWGEYTREHNFSLFTGVILEGPHEWTVRPVAELFVEREFDVETTYSGLVGAIWAVDDAFSLDVGVRGALIEGEHAEEVRLGFTWALPIWGSKDDAKVEGARRAAAEPRSHRTAPASRPSTRGRCVLKVRSRVSSRSASVRRASPRPAV